MKFIYNAYSQLETIDQILLIMLLISFLSMIIVKICCWVIYRRFNTDKTHKAPCVHLISGNHHNCSITVLGKKYFNDNELCDKDKCPGYRTSNYSIDEIKAIKKMAFHFSNNT